MYDTEEPNNKGPYYVPWKKSSMDMYNKIKEEKENIWVETRYKSQDGYIEGSTLGNVPTESKNKNDNK